MNRGTIVATLLLCLGVLLFARWWSTQPAARPSENVFQGQIHAVDKARGVQRTVDAAALRQRHAIDRESR